MPLQNSKWGVQAREFIKSTMCNGKITGYCVNIPDSDACAEFHSGTNQENLQLATIFARGINIRVGGEMFISITKDGYICSFGKESRTANSWQELVAWLKHHGEAAIKRGIIYLNPLTRVRE